METIQSFHRVNPLTVIQLSKVTGFKVKQFKKPNGMFFVAATMRDEFTQIDFISTEYIEEILDRKEVENRWEK